MRACVCACVLSLAGTMASGQLELQSLGTYVNPTFLTNAGDGSDRLFVIEKRGRIEVMDKDDVAHASEFLNIVDLVNYTNLEAGLLGMAFHPDYENNGRFYVIYTSDGPVINLVEYTVSANDPDRADPASARVIMSYARPTINHNGGWLGFGPDGYLYVTSGDGGPQNDPNDRAGDLTQRFGKIHRIGVDGGDDYPADPDHNYTIPGDNPFVDVPGAVPSIWAYGLRNPWRACFDRATDDLWIADVGQYNYEEVNFQPAGDPGGQHYGWRCREGFHDTEMACGSTSGFTDPVFEYTHGADGCSITGGYVYRGCALGDDYQGLYFFSDWCSGLISTLDKSDGYARRVEFDSGLPITSFGEDGQGELYVMTLSGGVYKIVNPDNPDGCDPGCRPDITGDGTLDFFDISAFLAAFTNEDPIADFTDDSSFDFFDISAFLNAFAKGCP